MGIQLSRNQIHQYLLFFFLIVVTVGMQFSHFLVSLGIILLSANYLAEGDFIRKWESIKKNPVIPLFVGLFLLHVIGLLWSTDSAYGLHDIQIKLPILALPLVLGAGKKLNTKQFEWLLIIFIATSLLSSIIGSVIYFFLSNPGDDYRNMSPFMSHIRLSLMMGMAMFSCIYLGNKSKNLQSIKSLFIGLAVWFFIYLLMLRAMSGIVAVLGAAAIVTWLYAANYSSKIKWTIRLSLLGGFLSLLIYILIQINNFYSIHEIRLDEVEMQSPRGEDYVFYVDIPLYENGNMVYSYIAYDELRNTWNQVSSIPCPGTDLKGQDIESTLTRYLTSKNLRKDQDGVLALSHLDIWAIENGIANVRYLDSKSINNLTYRYIWEVHNYINGINPQSNSFGQRFLFWKLGFEIFSENPITGVGTGDVQLAFNEKYANLPFQINKTYQLRAHNQFLTMGITFGVFGLLYFLFTLFSGVYYFPYGRSFLFVSFLTIFLVSMLDEDTLETQYGVTFALFFYFLFLFQQPEENIDHQKVLK